MMVKQVKRVMRPVALAAIGVASRGRVAGEDLDQASSAVRFLRQRGYDVTLSYWNQDDDSPAAVVAAYENALRAIDRIGGASYLSIKAPAFGFDARLFDGLLTRSQALGIPLHFDSPGPEDAERTFALFADCRAAPASAIGCTLPGRWKRSLGDAERLASLPGAIRVVKGEWPDPDAPAWDAERGFLDVVMRLAGRTGSVRVATHDSVLAQESVRILRRAGTPCDVELLYGFPVRSLVPQLRGLGVPIRVYVPFGHGWAPYCLQFVRSRPRFAWWLIRDSLSGPYRSGFPALQSGTAE